MYQMHSTTECIMFFTVESYLYMILHDKTMHNGVILNQGHRYQLQPLYYGYCKFEVFSLCNHGDMTQNVYLDCPYQRFAKML